MGNESPDLYQPENVERRANERCKSADCYAYFRPLKRWSWFKRFQGPCLIEDISISSARFDSIFTLTIGDEIELKIASVSSLASIKLKGKVFRSEKSVNPRSTLYVIQFNPYGNRAQYNSFQVKKQLEKYFSALANNAT